MVPGSMKYKSSSNDIPTQPDVIDLFFLGSFLSILNRKFSDVPRLGSHVGASITCRSHFFHQIKIIDNHDDMT